MTDIILPFPPSSLSGHAKGHWRAKAAVTAKHREWARNATLAASQGPSEGIGDIRILVTFYPPNRRGDRVNFPNRMKPYFDGIADALKVNDSRFLPSYQFADPVKGGQVVVSILSPEKSAGNLHSARETVEQKRAEPRLQRGTALTAATSSKGNALADEPLSRSTRKTQDKIPLDARPIGEIVAPVVAAVMTKRRGKAA